MTIPHPTDQTIAWGLQNYALLRSIMETQGTVAVGQAREAGWTYQRIMDETGLGYTAIRNLDPNLKGQVAA